MSKDQLSPRTRGPRTTHGLEVAQGVPCVPYAPSTGSWSPTPRRSTVAYAHAEGAPPARPPVPHDEGHRRAAMLGASVLQRRPLIDARSDEDDGRHQRGIRPWVRRHPRRLPPKAATGCPPSPFNTQSYESRYAETSYRVKGRCRNAPAYRAHAQRNSCCHECADAGSYVEL